LVNHMMGASLRRGGRPGARLSPRMNAGGVITYEMGGRQKEFSLIAPH